jgi:hypothetical protein
MALKQFENEFDFPESDSLFFDLIAFREISNNIINTFWLQINRHN